MPALCNIPKGIYFRYRRHLISCYCGRCKEKCSLIKGCGFHSVCYFHCNSTVVLEEDISKHFCGASPRIGTVHYNHETFLSIIIHTDTDTSYELVFLIREEFIRGHLSALNKYRVSKHSIAYSILLKLAIIHKVLINLYKAIFSNTNGIISGVLTDIGYGSSLPYDCTVPCISRLICRYEFVCKCAL